MKFLVIADMKDTALTLPPVVIRQLLEATFTVMNQHKKAGKILEFYWIPGWGRSVVIREAKSAEEINQQFSELPMGGFTNFEVYPLADLNESAKIILEGLKEAEKRFPAPPK